MVTVIDLTGTSSRLADLVALLSGAPREEAEAALASLSEHDDPWWQVATGLVSLRYQDE